jgi:hypothetical protein
MNVKELIEKLQTMPQDAMAIVSGYEGGVNEISSADECKIQLNVHDAWYYGKHDIEPDGDTVAVWIG